MSKVNDLLEKNNKLKSKKNIWINFWQEIATYVFPLKAQFTSSSHPSLDKGMDVLFDSTAIKSNKTMASSLIGMLWPSGSKSFKLKPAEGIEESSDIKDYFDFMTEKIKEAMDNPKSGLTTALDEFMLDEGSFGTSGILINSTEDIIDQYNYVPITYKALNVRDMSIMENPSGLVDTVYYEFDYTIKQAIQEYGEENLSEKTKEKIKDNKLDEDIRILHVIQPRFMLDKSKQGNMNKKFESIHIEIESKHIIKESGFDNIPAKIARFRKGIDETYGSSPAMDCLPDIRMANMVSKAMIIAIDKVLDPPLGVYSDGILGGGTINTSAGSITVFENNGKLGNNLPIFPINTVGDLKSAQFLLEESRKNIADHFFIDKLLDFNNETQMTATETNIRNQNRSATLRSVFARQISELFTPLIEYTFDALMKSFKLGVDIESSVGKGLIPEEEIIPEELVTKLRAGEKIFEIIYITPASRILQAEEAEGIIRTWEFASNLSPVSPEILDNLDPDESIREFAKIIGAPNDIFKNERDVENQRMLRANQMQQQQQLNDAEQLARTVKDAGSLETK